jgi:hypothetical protein
MKTACKYNLHKIYKLKLFCIFDDINHNKHLIPVLLINLEKLLQISPWIEENLCEYMLYFKKFEDYLIKDKAWRNLNSFLEAHLKY